ncbi:MAG TPA: hypothetical protein VKY45_06165, partial [Marinilabiliaceae bacterium]|nr:hypothetical protein [Marinilabiliaceae bacterium]
RIPYIYRVQSRTSLPMGIVSQEQGCFSQGIPISIGTVMNVERRAESLKLRSFFRIVKDNGKG